MKPKKVRPKPKAKVNPSIETHNVIILFSTGLKEINNLRSVGLINPAQQEELRIRLNEIGNKFLNKARGGNAGQAEAFLNEITRLKKEALERKKQALERDNPKPKIVRKRTSRKKTIKPLKQAIIPKGQLVKPTKKGIRLAENEAMRISSEIRALQKKQIVLKGEEYSKNISQIQSLEVRKQWLIDYMYAKLPADHKIAVFLNSV